MASEFMLTHRGLFEGTMKVASAVAKLLFQAMILNADRDGVVKGAVEHWSSYLCYPPIPISDIEGAIMELEAPDPKSTTTDYEGRRIIPIANNTWLIVNYFEYRNALQDEKRRTQLVEAKRRSRSKHLPDGVAKLEQSGDSTGKLESPQDNVDVSTNVKDVKLTSSKPAFVAPTLEEVRRFFQDHAYPSHEANSFFESRGGIWVANWEGDARAWHNNPNCDPTAAEMAEWTADQLELGSRNTAYSDDVRKMMSMALASRTEESASGMQQIGGTI